MITSTGAVTKRAFTFDEPLDPGLADWAASYLNERLAGTDLGALTLQSKLDSPELSPTERAFLETLSPGVLASWPRRSRTPSTSRARRGCSTAAGSTTSTRSTT